MKRSLVNYSSSDSSETEDNNGDEIDDPLSKGKNSNYGRLPSVPSAVRDMYQGTEITENEERLSFDDSQKHGGRVRTFQHERGNWATCVHIPFEMDLDFEDFSRHTLELLSDVTEFHLIETPHISVTKTFPIRYHIIVSLMDSIRDALSNISMFTCFLNDLDVYVNEEKTRTFVGLKVTHGHNELVKIISSLDSILKQYRLPVYYKEPSFHLSFAWCLGDYSSYFTQKKLHQLRELLVSEDGENMKFLKMHVSHLEYKSGNKQISLKLKE